MYDSRDDINPKYRFDLTRIFPTHDAWRAEYDSLDEDIDDFDSDRPLRTLLIAFESLSARDHCIRTYASLRADIATGDDQRIADRARAESLHTDLLSIQNIVERRIQQRDSNGTEDIPDRFERYVTNVQHRGQHALSPDAEELLSTLTDVLDAPKRVHRALVDRDFQPPTIEIEDDSETKKESARDSTSVTLTRTERSRIQREGERETRKRAFRAVRDTFMERSETLATNLDTMVRRNIRLAGARGYESALEATLDGDDSYVACRPQSRLPREVYDTLVTGIRENLEPKHRLTRIRRDALSVDTLKPWDGTASPVDGDAPRYEFEEARDMLLRAFEPLGDAYLSRVSDMFDERRIDAFDYPGKTEQGAGYATTAPDVGPFVLARWNGSLSHLFLLAHELGHAVQFSLLEDARSHVNAGIPDPTAELPSKLNEILLANHLLNETADDERAAIAVQAVRSIGSNLFYSARWSVFTHQVHEQVAVGECLTVDWLDETYGDLFTEFNPLVEPIDRLRAGWTTGLYSIPLYHHYPYILGTTGALAVADRLGNNIAASEYLEFLESGMATPSDVALKELGVDVTSNRAVERGISQFEQYVDALARTCR